MIVIPALAGIVAILEPIIAGAVIGVAASTVVCAGGGAVSGIQSQGTAGEVATSAFHATRSCAEDGTLVEAGLIGGAFGGVAHVAAPALNAVGSAAKPVVAAADDIFGPALRGVGSALDDVARGIGSAVDDIGTRLGIGAHSARMSIEKVVTTSLRSVRKGLPPPVQRLLPKTTRSSGFVYVFDDSAAGAQKIGMSIDPRRRLGQVKSPSGAKPKIVCTISTYNMKALEGALHTAYAGQRLPNTGAGTEWFKLSNAQVKAICG